MTKSIEWLKARPIAHRGLHNVNERVIENTKTAFARAIAGNYTIECDLQVSADGEAMVFHDPDLKRLTVQSQDVNSLMAKELKTTQFKNSDDRIQTLEELLTQVDGKVPLVIEIKSLVDGDLRLAERTVDVLSRYKGDHCIMSFGPFVMNAIKQLSPDTLRGAVVMPATEKLWTEPQGQNSTGKTMLETVDPAFVSYDIRGLPSEFVWKFRSPEKPVISWTIKNTEMAETAYKYTDQITFEGFKP